MAVGHLACLLSPAGPAPGRAISSLPQSTALRVRRWYQEGVIWRRLPTCQALPTRPPIGEATDLVSALPRQVTTPLPCQDDIRSLHRDLTQASVLGSRLLLS